MKFITKVIAWILSLIFSVIPVNVHTAPYDYPWEDNGDIEIIRQRLVSEKINNKLDITDIIDDLQEDGSFKSIDYYTEKKDTWHPIKHLQKLLNMQIAYKSPENPFYKNEEVRDGILLATHFWIDSNFRCDWNWWWNDIGTGMYIPDFMLFGVDGLDEESSTKLLAGVDSNMLYNRPIPTTIKERLVNQTGGNLTDQALATMKVAVIKNDGNTLMWIRDLLQNELRVFPTYKPLTDRRDCEGIKEDMSFQQHEQLVYFGGYCEVFTSGINRYLRYTKDTQYCLDEKALNNYAEFLIEGMQFAARNGFRDINASGRGIIRPDSLKGVFYNVKDSIETVLAFESIERRDDLERILKTRYGGIDGGAGGHRYFYESDYNVYNGRKYMASVRHASRRTRIFEYINGENPLAYYTGLGATFFYVDGDEYYNALPLYDWNKIPGTTTRQGHLPRFSEGKSASMYNNTDEVGGVSDSCVGASYINQIKQGVKSTQAYFMFEDGVVCLGTDIIYGGPGELVTDINQARHTGNVVLGRNGKRTVLSSGFEIKGKFDYIHHDSISYITASEVTLSLEHKDGDWKTVNERMDSRPVSCDMFNLYISHGTKPESRKYDYTVLMNTNLQETERYIKKPYLVTLENNNRVQAVYDMKNNVLEAVFHMCGELVLPTGRTVSVSYPCVLMLKETDRGRELIISSHDFRKHSVVVSVDGERKMIKADKTSQTFLF